MELTEFSLVIKASQDPVTNEMRWKASASDIGEDSFNDNMSIELYQDFIRRIESSEIVPEQFRSNFWMGGMPYLSISHYPDLEGKAVPGTIEAAYIDGDCNKACFKSKGTFSDTPIGRAAFEAVKDNPNQPEDKKVRVSIGFLDWMHKHKSNNYLFERQDVEDICPECLKEMLKDKSVGKIYLAGQLVHEALTRVPANKRTEMEVDRTMTTRKEDAESIIGEELAEDIDKEAKLVGKSEALVIKAEDEDVLVEKMTRAQAEKECTDPKTGKVDRDCVRRKLGKEGGKDGDGDTGDRGGKPHDEGQDGGDGGGIIAQHPGGFRPKAVVDDEEDCDCNDPKNMEKEKCKGKKKEKADFDELKAQLAEIKSLIHPEPAPEHILDAAISKLKADFDDAITVSNLPVDDRLKLLQPAFDQLGEIVKEKVSLSSIPVQETVHNDVQSQPDVVKAFIDALQPIQQQLGLLSAQMAELKRPPTTQVVQVPERRSLNPQLIQQKSTVVKSETPNLRAIIDRTTN